MGTQNQKGQALVEMALVMSMFFLFWMAFQKSIDSQKSGIKKWKIGHDAKVQFKKNN
jgi:hypothetical protein